MISRHCGQVAQSAGHRPYNPQVMSSILILPITHNREEGMMIEQGRLVQIEYGVYSDYVVCGYFRVLKSFDPKAELASYVDRHGFVDDSSFVFEMEESGYIEFIPCDKWFLTDSGKLDSMRYTKNDKCNPGQL